MKQEEKNRLKEWESYLSDIRLSTVAEKSLTKLEIEQKKDYLEKHPAEWIQYFFPKYARYPFAKFHLRAINRIVNNPEWYEVLSWSRELAKSTIVMFCVLYLALTGRKRCVILASATEKSAEKLLKPYIANLQANQRIIQFYGKQETPSQWTVLSFKAKCGCSFYGIGAGNAPRGVRNENVRPDEILVDDFDTDEDCRNPDTVDKKWDWFEKALYPTRSVSEPTQVIFCGNIIAKDTCVARAGARADHWDVINIVDKDGNSTWPEKNTPGNIERIRSTLSKKAFEGEYMNNPVEEGKIFKNIIYTKVPDLKKFKFLVLYGDPSYSNKGARRNEKKSKKSVVLLGLLKGTYYVINCRIGNYTNAVFIDNYIELLKYVAKRTTVYCYIENNSLQDPFYEQVFTPLIRETRQKERIDLYIYGDTRKKSDKGPRIEAALEPLVRNGRLVFNEEFKDNPNMQEMVDEFRLFTLLMPYGADGPDSVEGGKYIIDQKTAEMQPVDTIGYKDYKDMNDNRM